MHATAATEAEVVNEYLPLVRRVAGRLVRETRLRVDVEDVVQHGLIGLIDAWRKFDPDAGTPFRAWAMLHIKGRMLDAIPSMTGCSRAQIRLVRRIKAASDYAGSAEEAWAGRESPQDDASYVDQVVGGVLLIDDVSQFRDDDDEHDDGVTTGRSGFRANPEQIFRHTQLRGLVRECLADMERDERHLLEQHYFHERALSDVCEEMGISRSWACRLHVRAVENLRRALARRDPAFE